jgi:ABC-type protease/lipase transport system fused ATPase/permease subunit
VRIQIMQKKFNQTETKINPLKAALEKCKAAFKVTFVFAFFINLLMLVTPLYSLQVLDTRLSSFLT